MTAMQRSITFSWAVWACGTILWKVWCISCHTWKSIAEPVHYILLCRSFLHIFLKTYFLLVIGWTQIYYPLSNEKYSTQRGDLLPISICLVAFWSHKIQKNSINGNYVSLFIYFIARSLFYCLINNLLPSAGIPWFSLLFVVVTLEKCQTPLRLKHSECTWEEKDRIGKTVGILDTYWE